MRISDWSSDVCSSDLRIVEAQLRLDLHHEPAAGDAGDRAQEDGAERTRIARGGGDRDEAGDRTRTGAEQRSLVAERALGEHPEEDAGGGRGEGVRSEEHTSELQSLMRISYAVFCL